MVAPRSSPASTARSWAHAGLRPATVAELVAVAELAAERRLVAYLDYFDAGAWIPALEQAGDAELAERVRRALTPASGTFRISWPELP